MARWKRWRGSTWQLAIISVGIVAIAGICIAILVSLLFPIEEPRPEATATHNISVVDVQPVVNSADDVILGELPTVEEIAEMLRIDIAGVKIAPHVVSHTHPACKRLSMLGVWLATDTDIHAGEMRCGPNVPGADASRPLFRVGNDHSCLLVAAAPPSASPAVHERTAALHSLSIPGVPDALCIQNVPARNRAPVLALAGVSGSAPDVRSWQPTTGAAMVSAVRGAARMLAGLRLAGVGSCLASEVLLAESEAQLVLADTRLCTEVTIVAPESIHSTTSGASIAEESSSGSTDSLSESEDGADSGTDSGTDAEDVNSDEETQRSSSVRKDDTTSAGAALPAETQRDLQYIETLLAGMGRSGAHVLRAWEAAVPKALADVHTDSQAVIPPSVQSVLRVENANMTALRTVIENVCLNGGDETLTVPVEDAVVRLRVTARTEGHDVHAKEIDGVSENLCLPTAPYAVFDAFDDKRTDPIDIKWSQMDATSVATSLVALTAALHSEGYVGCLAGDRGISATNARVDRDAKGRATVRLVDGSSCAMGTQYADDWKLVLAWIGEQSFKPADRLMVRSACDAALATEIQDAERIRVARPYGAFAPFAPVAGGKPSKSEQMALNKTCPAALDALRSDGSLKIPARMRGPNDLPLYGRAPHFVPITVHTPSGPAVAALRVLPSPNKTQGAGRAVGNLLSEQAHIHASSIPCVTRLLCVTMNNRAGAIVTDYFDGVRVADTPYAAMTDAAGVLGDAIDLAAGLKHARLCKCIRSGAVHTNGSATRLVDASGCSAGPCDPRENERVIVRTVTRVLQEAFTADGLVTPSGETPADIGIFGDVDESGVSHVSDANDDGSVESHFIDSDADVENSAVSDISEDLDESAFKGTFVCYSTSEEPRWTESELPPSFFIVLSLLDRAGTLKNIRTAPTLYRWLQRVLERTASCAGRHAFKSMRNIMTERSDARTERMQNEASIEARLRQRVRSRVENTKAEEHDREERRHANIKKAKLKTYADTWRNEGNDPAVFGTAPRVFADRPVHTEKTDRLDKAVFHRADVYTPADELNIGKLNAEENRQRNLKDHILD